MTDSNQQGMGNPPPAPPAPPAAPPAPPTAPTSSAPADGDEPGWLKDRLERARKQALKEALGTGNADEIKARLKKADELEKAQVEAEKAKLSEIERARLEADEHRRVAEEAKAGRQQAELQAHMYKIFAAKKITNFDYGMHLVTTKVASLGEGEELDEIAYLDEVMKDPRQSAALGIEVPAAPPPTTRVPAGTSPAKGAAPTPPDPNAAPGPKSAYDKSPTEWADFKKQFGIA